LTRQIAAAFDQLATDLKAAARQPTIGTTESLLFGDLARLLVVRAARLRSAADDTEDERDRDQARARALAERVAAGYDPAQHTVNEVNDYLAEQDEAERARVLGLEAEDRPEVAETRKQRTGILSGPHGAFHGASF
jgi:hypothetical protein